MANAEHERMAGLEFRQLHPATLWLPMVNLLGGLLVPAIIGSFILSPRAVLTYGGLFVVLPSVLSNILRWLTFRYALGENELVVRSGVLDRQVRHIPYERIQDVRWEQSLVYRLLGFAKVEVETAASESVELSLNVVTLPAAEELRAAALRRLRVSETAPDSALPPAVSDLHRCTFKELMLGGLTGQIVTFISAVIGALIYFEVLSNVGPPEIAALNPVSPFEQRWERMVQEFTERVPLPKVIVGLLMGDTLGKALVLGAVGLVVSSVGFVLRYYGFRLYRTGDLIQRSFGLLTQRQFGVPLGRIQVLLIEETLLRRWAGLASLRIDTASHRETQQEDKEKPRQGVLAPVLPAGNLAEVLGQVLPGLQWEGIRWEQVSPRAVWRRTRRDCLVILVIAAANVHLLGAYAAALLALCPLVFILNRQWYRQLGYALTDDHFLVRRGWLKRSTAIIPLQNVQSVAWVQRPWERRAALASLLVDAAGEDYTGGIPRLPYLPLAQAEELLRRLARAGAERPFAW